MQTSVNAEQLIGEYRDHTATTTHELLFTRALLKEAQSRIIELQTENAQLKASLPSEH